MTLNLLDEKGQLQPRLLSHQERHQQHTAFHIPVPQDPDVSDQIGDGSVTLLRAATARADRILIDIPLGITINPRWFFTFPNHNKVYMADITIDFDRVTDQIDHPFKIYPELRKNVPNGTALQLFPSMRCKWNEFLSEDDAAIDRQVAEVFTVELIEVLFG